MDIQGVAPIRFQTITAIPSGGRSALFAVARDQHVEGTVISVEGDTVVVSFGSLRVEARVTGELNPGDQLRLLVREASPDRVVMQIVARGGAATTMRPLADADLRDDLTRAGVPADAQSLSVARELIAAGQPVTAESVLDVRVAMARAGALDLESLRAAVFLKAQGLPLTASTLRLARQALAASSTALGQQVQQLRESLASLAIRLTSGSDLQSPIPAGAEAPGPTGPGMGEGLAALPTGAAPTSGATVEDSTSEPASTDAAEAGPAAATAARSTVAASDSAETESGPGAAPATEAPSELRSAGGGVRPAEAPPSGEAGAPAVAGRPAPRAPASVPEAMPPTAGDAPVVRPSAEPDAGTAPPAPESLGPSDQVGPSRSGGTVASTPSPAASTPSPAASTPSPAASPRPADAGPDASSAPAPASVGPSVDPRPAAPATGSPTGTARLAGPTAGAALAPADAGARAGTTGSAPAAAGVAPAVADASVVSASSATPPGPVSLARLLDRITQTLAALPSLDDETVRAGRDHLAATVHRIVSDQATPVEAKLARLLDGLASRAELESSLSTDLRSTLADLVDGARRHAADPRLPAAVQADLQVVQERAESLLGKIDLQQLANAAHAAQPGESYVVLQFPMPGRDGPETVEIRVRQEGQNRKIDPHDAHVVFQFKLQGLQTVRVSVRVLQRHLSCQVGSSDPGATELLRQHAPELKAGLGSLGYAVDDVRCALLTPEDLAPPAASPADAAPTPPGRVLRLDARA